jgi:hypothetical protein
VFVFVSAILLLFLTHEESEGRLFVRSESCLQHCFVTGYRLILMFRAFSRSVYGVNTPLSADGGYREVEILAAVNEVARGVRPASSDAFRETRSIKFLTTCRQPRMITSAKLIAKPKSRKVSIHKLLMCK